MMKALYLFLLMALISGACQPPQMAADREEAGKNTGMMNKSEEEWKDLLSPEQYAVLREKATERPFTGKYDQFSEEGIYHCAGCDAELFSSDDKFDAGCGWPSFSDALEKGRILEKEDRSHGMVRTEILCASCGGHLGHVFDDGPRPTGLRYCVNSVSLDFSPLNK